MTGPSRGPTTTAHKVACWLVLLAILLVGAEGLSFAFAKLRPGLFSQRDKVVATLGEKLDRYPEFLARAYDPVLGWDNVPGEHRIQACDGRPVTVTIRPDRSRRTPAVVGGPEVLLVGDSYTYGDEVGDEETFAWRLSERLGVAVANHGVQGYSPVQAMLKLERVADAHPRARVAVLAVTHVDLARMVSRYRPLVDPKGGQDFGFEPYMDGDRLVPNPNGPTPVPAEQLPELARAAFAEDWHALPEARFPYSLRVAQLLGGHKLYRLLAEKYRGSYRGYFQDRRVMAGLAAVADRFVAHARARGMEPVIAFVPTFATDREDAGPGVTTLVARLGTRAIVTAVGDEPGGWDRYNIRSGCHPSAYGHELIATRLARVIGPLLDPARAGLAAGRS
jgi:hypothetical protein